MTGVVATRVRAYARKVSLFSGALITIAMAGTSAVMAQAANCGPTTQSGPGAVNNLNLLAAPAGAAAGTLSGAIGTVNTAFLTQQGSAFVSAPGNPQPNQPGGGLWIRGVGGEVTTKSTSASTGVFNVPTNAAGNTTGFTNCSNSQRQEFSGVQIGQDISRLNWNGWNLHLGTTAGYLSSKTRDGVSGFGSEFEVPFFGTYLVATYGRFFADLMVREEFYNMTLDNRAQGFINQPIGARGLSVSASAGYNFALANNWFIEPSGGFIWSKTKVDSFNYVGSPGLQISGTNSIDDVKSEIGRLSVRAGTTFTSHNVNWQPFASASVFHEFAGDVTSTYAAMPNSLFFGLAGSPATFTQQTNTSRVGTYGQYSLGLAGQIVNTGWLGFARVDYRNGSNIEGWTGNAGVRYQFTPEMIAAVMPTKIPVKAHPLLAPVVWSGFYVGGFLGGAYGKTDMRFVGDAANSGNNPRVFGGLGGGQVGYNWQINKWVIGVEGDIGGANIKGSRPCGTTSGLAATGLPINGPAGFSPAFMTCTDKMDWLASATVRVGYAYERTLYYVKAGAAWTNDTMSVGCIIDPALNGAPAVAPNGPRQCLNQAGVLTNGFSAGSGTRTGWTVGYGTEFDLGRNWSAKAEYDYTSFGEKTSLASDGTTLLRDGISISQVKVGLNYRFAPSLVTAKF